MFFSIKRLLHVKNRAYIEAFGTHLRKLREEKGFSQQQLADTADIAKITIQRIELAKFATTLDVLVSISKALDIEVSSLVDFKVEE